MKRFVIKFITITVIVILVILGCCFLIPHDKNDYLSEFSHKVSLIRDTKSPRIIFIGGSNVAFGLDSRRIQDSLKMNVVNMGLHAGLGIRFTLSQCLPYIRKGDIVVMDVEYSNFFTGSYGESSTLADEVIANNGLGLTSMNLTQLLSMASGFPKVAFTNIQRLVTYTKTKSFDTPAPRKGQPYEYCASGFNKYGDEVSHWYLKPDGILRLNDPANNWKYDNDFGQWYFNNLRSISRKATVIIMPPALAHTSFNIQRKYIYQLASIYKSEGFPYAADPESMSIPDEDMYNTNYHCSKSGVDLNTGRIINVLNGTLNK